jgi:cell wall-associated NlpC family hydrolase
MADFDPRVTPARPDLAAQHLRGKVNAAQYVAGMLREVRDASAPLRTDPRPDARLFTEALKGEHFTVYDIDDEGWCWGQIESDSYVGWLAADALTAPGPAPTHRVRAPRTLVFADGDIKNPATGTLPMGALVAVTRDEGRLAATSAGFVPAAHLMPIAEHETDFVAVAERFLGTPYLWGGKTNLGIDCSGIVQIALTASGIACPRDSDMQEKALGAAVASAAELRRGDLIFWKGHVAIARDAETMIHANAHHMAVTIEPTNEGIARIQKAGSEVTSVRRASNPPSS